MSNMENRRTYLCWVSVGGNDCEPARMHEGKIYTIGCSDGTEYKEGCGIEMAYKILNAPKTPKEQARLDREWKLKIEQDIKNGIRHGYRYFS